MVFLGSVAVLVRRRDRSRDAWRKTHFYYSPIFLESRYLRVLKGYLKGFNCRNLFLSMSPTTKLRNPVKKNFKTNFWGSFGTFGINLRTNLRPIAVNFCFVESIIANWFSGLISTLSDVNLVLNMICKKSPKLSGLRWKQFESLSSFPGGSLPDLE